MKAIIFTIILIIAFTQQGIQSKQYSLIDECQYLSADQEPSPIQLGFDNQYNDATDFSMVGWFKYSKNQKFSGKHVLFILIQGRDEQKRTKLSSFIDSSKNEITFCTYDESRDNQIFCKSSPFEIKKSKWFVVSFSYNSITKRAFAQYQYQNEEIQTVSLNDVLHVKDTYYQIDMGQSDVQQNFPGYICHTRLGSGPESLYENGLEDEFQLLLQISDPEPSTKYPTIGNQKVLLEDLISGQSYVVPISNSLFIENENVQAVDELSVVGWFKLYNNNYSSKQTVGYQVSQNMYNYNNRVKDCFFQFSQEPNNYNFIFQSYTDYTKGYFGITDNVNQFTQYSKYTADSFNQWFLVYQGYSFILKKMVIQISFPGKAPVILSKDDVWMQQNSLYRINVGFQGYPSLQPWNGLIKNFRFCAGKNCFYQSYPEKEIQFLPQIQAIDDQEDYKRQETIVVKRRILDPSKGDLPTAQEFANLSPKEFSFSSWFKPVNIEKNGVMSGNMFRFGQSNLKVAPHLQAQSEPDFYFFQGYYQYIKEQQKGSIYILGSNRYPDTQTHISYQIPLNAQNWNKWFYIYFGYSDSTQQLQAYVTVDGKVQVNQIYKQWSVAHHYYQQFVVGGFGGWESQLQSTFNGEIANAKVCAGKGCYQESGFESNPPDENNKRNLRSGI